MSISALSPVSSRVAQGMQSKRNAPLFGKEAIQPETSKALLDRLLTDLRTDIDSGRIIVTEKRLTSLGKGQEKQEKLEAKIILPAGQRYNADMEIFDNNEASIRASLRNTDDTFSASLSPETGVSAPTFTLAYQPEQKKRFFQRKEETYLQTTDPALTDKARQVFAKLAQFIKKATVENAPNKLRY